MRFARASNSARYEFTDPCCDNLNRVTRRATDRYDTSTETNSVQRRRGKRKQPEDARPLEYGDIQKID